MSKRKQFDFTYYCLGCQKEFRTNKIFPYGWICQKCMKNVKLTLNCSICGKEINLTWDHYIHQHQNTFWLCDSCRDEYKSVLNKFLWNNKTEEEKKLHSEQAKEQWKYLTPEQKKEKSKYRNNGRDKYYLNLTEEEWIKRSNNIKNSLANESPEHKEQRFKAISETLKKYFQNLPYEEFIRINHKKAINCNNIPNDEKIKSIDSPCELIFMELLDSYQIPYKLHYYNTSIYDDLEYYYPNFDDFKEYTKFRTLFPVNPNTGSMYISPFHEWDFAIIKDNKFYMFIDVDGSVHNPNNMNFNFHGRHRLQLEYNVAEDIRFNDSQRLYQTDGHGAYIVQCYNDKLLDDTPVLNLQMNTKRTLKNFLENLSKLINK